MKNQTCNCDPLSKDADNSSVGGGNIADSGGYLFRRGRARQGISSKANSLQNHWQTRQHNLAIELQPSVSDSGTVGGVNRDRGRGARNEGAHSSNHRQQFKRSASHQQHNMHSRNSKDCCGDHDQSRRKSESVDNKEGGTGFEGTNEARGHFLLHHEHGHAHDLKMYNSFYTPDHSSLPSGTEIQGSEAGISTYWRPITSSLPNRRPWLDTFTYPNTNNRDSEDMAKKGEMEYGNGDDNSIGGITNFPSSVSYEMPIDVHVVPLGAGTESHEMMPFKQVWVLAMCFSD